MSLIYYRVMAELYGASQTYLVDILQSFCVINCIVGIKAATNELPEQAVQLEISNFTFRNVVYRHLETVCKAFNALFGFFIHSSENEEKGEKKRHLMFNKELESVQVR